MVSARVMFGAVLLAALAVGWLIAVPRLLAQRTPPPLGFSGPAGPGQLRRLLSYVPACGFAAGALVLLAVGLGYLHLP